MLAGPVALLAYLSTRRDIPARLADCQSSPTATRRLFSEGEFAYRIACFAGDLLATFASQRLLACPFWVALHESQPGPTVYVAQVQQSPLGHCSLGSCTRSCRMCRFLQLWDVTKFLTCDSPCRTWQRAFPVSDCCPGSSASGPTCAALAQRRQTGDPLRPLSTLANGRALPFFVLAPLR